MVGGRALARIGCFGAFQGLLQAEFSPLQSQLKLRTPPPSQGIFTVRTSPDSAPLTIGRLARAAGVGVETVRYYQERKLLPVPPNRGAFRYYPVGQVGRIRFIKQAQELGFSLEEIGELLQLEDGADRGSIRRIAADRLLQIEAKLGALKRMQRVLKGLLNECEHTEANLPCPIIGTIRERSASPAVETKRRGESSRNVSRQPPPAA